MSIGKITSYSLLRFEGADAQNFLHGQLTSDVNALAAGQYQYTGYCTAKGRLLCTGLLWREDDASWLLMLPRELAEPIRKRLSMYILRAKVKASDAGDRYALYGVSGEPPPAFASATVLALAADRYLLAAPAGTASVETSGTLDWAALDIAAGIPMITAATQEQFVPQTVNLDCIGAVSFSKGCYPGQEIVARSHYLGKIKQRMVRAHVGTSSTAAAAGDKLYAEEFGGQTSGMIVNAVAAASGGSDVLAVVHTTSVTQGGIHWQAADGPLLTVGTLPYVVA